MNDHPTIFLAGATGAVGRVLCRLLVEAGYDVTGLTRAAEKAPMLESLGVKPVIANVYDTDLLTALIHDAQPTIIIHQLTDLPYGVPADKMAAARVHNDKIRDVGTRNLIQACQGIAVTRFIAQSISFAYQAGPLPHVESDPLSSESLTAFENQVLEGNFAGIVLRYGRFYGPHTGAERLEGPNRVHVDAAAQAALLAVTRGQRGVYNIAEDEEEVTSQKAIRELGWNPAFRT
jgi:nucleoside-diphosphate-sugar epimerase